MEFLRVLLLAWVAWKKIYENMNLELQFIP